MWRCDNCETRNDAGDSYCKVCGNAQNPKTVSPIDTQARKECSSESIMEQLGDKLGSNTIFENKTTITERPIKKGCALLIVGGLTGLCMCCLEAWFSVLNDGFLKYVHEVMILVMMIVSIAGFTFVLFMVQKTFLYDDHLESGIKMANMKMKVKYYQINLVLETKGLYLLWGAFHGFTVISKNGFVKGNAAEFERFICRNAVNAKIKLM